MKEDMLEGLISDEVRANNVTQCPYYSCRDHGRKVKCYFEVYRNCTKYLDLENERKNTNPK